MNEKRQNFVEQTVCFYFLTLSYLTTKNEIVGLVRENLYHNWNPLDLFIPSLYCPQRSRRHNRAGGHGDGI